MVSEPSDDIVCISKPLPSLEALTRPLRLVKPTAPPAKVPSLLRTREVTEVVPLTNRVKLLVRTLLSETPSPSPACATKLLRERGTNRVHGMNDTAVAPDRASGFPTSWIRRTGRRSRSS